MSAYFECLVDFVGAHPQLSFLAVFLLALSEAVPVVGTVVPGSFVVQLAAPRYGSLKAFRGSSAVDFCTQTVLKG
jgi:hypothetical protein